MASQLTGVSEIAERYAAALFELADEQKRLDEVADDLRGLRELLSESEDLRRLVRSPVISREDQARAMTAILEKAGAGELTRNFVGVVAAHRRLFALEPMIAAYLAELARRRGEITAHVTTAHKLEDAQMSALTAAIKKVVASDKVSVDLKVDPAVIGGLVVRIGSRLFDGSLRNKLQKLELAMKGVA